MALLGAVALAVTTTPASAEEAELSVALPKRDGIRVLFGVDNNVAELAVVQRGSGALRASSYLHANQRFTVLGDDGSVRADLGSQGRVRARFVPRRGGERRAGEDVCVSQTVDRHGHLVGRIVLRGVPGVEPVRKHRVKATLTTYGKRDCQAGRGEDEKPPRFAALSACNRRTGASYGVLAYADRPRVRSFHFADMVELPSDDVLVFRTVFLQDDPETFTWQEDPPAATVQPGFPFSGTAALSGERLIGDLSVSFLGLREPVALAPGSADFRVSRSSSLETECGSSGSIGVGWRDALAAGPAGATPSALRQLLPAKFG